MKETNNQHGYIDIPMGCRVTSKKTGLPMIGTVHGVITAGLYMYSHKINPDSEYPWDNLYPEWRDDFVCYVKFDELQKPLTFEEYKNVGEKQGLNKSDEWYRAHYEDIKEVPCAAYPIQDLEIFEE